MHGTEPWYPQGVPVIGVWSTLCLLSALCTPALCCTKENVLREEEWKKQLFSTRSTGVPLGRRIQLPPSLSHQRVTPGTTQGRAPSLEGCNRPGSPQFMLGINWKSDTTRQQPQSPNYSKLRVRVFGKSQLPRAALHFPPSGSKYRTLFCVCFMNLLSTQYPVCVVHMLAKY